MDVVKLRHYKTSSEHHVNVPHRLVKEYFQGVEQFFVSMVGNKLVYEPIIEPIENTAEQGKGGKNE